MVVATIKVLVCVGVQLEVVMLVAVLGVLLVVLVVILVVVSVAAMLVVIVVLVVVFRAKMVVEMLTFRTFLSMATTHIRVRLPWSWVGSRTRGAAEKSHVMSVVSKGMSGAIVRSSKVVVGEEMAVAEEVDKMVLVDLTTLM